MRKLTTEELAILHDHEKWLNGEKTGVMANFNTADLSGADLRTVNLCKASLRYVDLTGADLKKATLKKVDLTGTDLHGADLTGADLSGANLYGANLNRSHLSEADLYSANLSNANLARADLRKANLTGAYLYRADLTGANLYGADLRDAILTGANLSEVRSMLSFGPIGSRHKFTYAIRHAECVMVRCGCFWGTLEKWVECCREAHGDTAHGKAYAAAADFIRAYAAAYWQEDTR